MGTSKRFQSVSLRGCGKIPSLDGPLTEKLKTELLNAKKEPELKEVITGGGKNFRRLYDRKFDIVAKHVEAALVP